MANAPFGSLPANQDANQIPGTTLTDNASVGNTGETNSATQNASGGVVLTSGTVANVVSMSLTAGDWDLSGMVNFAFVSATQSGDTQAGASAVSANLPGSDYLIGNLPLRLTTTTCNASIVVPTQRISIAVTGTYYLVALANFSAGTCKASGIIYARRSR